MIFFFSFRSPCLQLEPSPPLQRLFESQLCQHTSQISIRTTRQAAAIDFCCCFSTWNIFSFCIPSSPALVVVSPHFNVSFEIHSIISSWNLFWNPSMLRSCILVSLLVDAYLRSAFIELAFAFTPRLLWRVTHVHASSPAQWKKFKRKYCKTTYFLFSKVQTLQQRICVQIYIDKRGTSNACEFLLRWASKPYRGHLDLLLHFVCALVFS